MKIANPCLDRLITDETLHQALSLLRPRELAAAALRADGLTDVQIAELLGITPNAVSARISRARERIIDCLPDLRVSLDGRHSPLTQGAPQLSGMRAVFTPAALAEETGASPATVRRWCAEGRFPGAWRTDSGRWRIPAEAVSAFQPPASRGPCRRAPRRRAPRRPHSNCHSE